MVNPASYGDMILSDKQSIPFTKIVRELPSVVPFVGPDTQERQSGIRFRARLGANESCYGPSPSALAAMQEAAGISWQYGDADNHDLRTALAEFHGVEVENIVVGEGIDGLLGCLCQMFVEPGVNVVSSLGSYPTFNFHVQSRGGTLRLVPYVQDREDRFGLLAAAQETNATIVYFSNPNNPMGTWWDAGEMQEMINALPAGAILALDEAYIEAAPDGVAPPIDVSAKNVLRFRTFSKLYGMAGARIGYVIGHPELISAFDKVRNHYGVNLVAQRGALTALQDQAYLADVKGRVEKARNRIGEIAHSHGLEVLPSATNFVTIDCGRDSSYAREILSRMLARGVFLRMPGVEPLARCIRVSVGLDHELDLFEEQFSEVLDEMKTSK